MRTVKCAALILGPIFLKINGLAHKGKLKYKLLNDVRDGDVFRLCGAPSTDLTATLLSTATSHDSISSMGDHISRTVRMALVSWIASNIRYIRCLQGIDNHHRVGRLYK